MSQEVFPYDPDTPRKLQEAAKRRGTHPVVPEAPVIAANLVLLLAEHRPQMLSRQVTYIIEAAKVLAGLSQGGMITLPDKLDINPLDKECLLGATRAQIRKNTCFTNCFRDAVWIAPGLFLKDLLKACIKTVPEKLEARGIDSKPVIELEYFLQEDGSLRDALRRGGRNLDSLCIRLQEIETKVRGQEMRLQKARVKHRNRQKPKTPAWKVPGLPDNLTRFATVLAEHGGKLESKTVANEVGRHPCKIMSDYRHGKWAWWPDKYIERDGAGLWWLKSTRKRTRSRSK